MKNRGQIDKKYLWNTLDIYANEKEFNNDLQKLKDAVKEINEYEGKLNTADNILKYFEFSNNLSQTEEKLGAYLTLNHSENMANQKFVQQLNILGSIETELSVAGSFVEKELIDNGQEFLKNLIKDVRFKNYAHDIDNLIRNASHVLDKDKEMIVSKTGDFAGGFGEVFDNIDAVDVKFKPFKVNGKEYKVNNSNFGLLLENKNSDVRKNAFINLHRGYMDLANTISTNYIANLKVDKFYSDVYGYKSALQASLFGNNLPEGIYHNLINQVHNNVTQLHQYLGLRKKLLKLNSMTYSDLRCSVVNFKKSYTYEQMKDVVLNALAPLGLDYVNVVKNAFNSRWIDVYPTENKDTGGYCLRVYGVHPYILLNTVENMESMFTLIHEMGHAMHSYLSDKTQVYARSHYPIFLAEIASTTNEVLLIKYLYKNSVSVKEKVYLLDKYLQMFRTTIFRQTMFSEFEDYAHSLVENNLSVSKDILCKKYGQLNNFYHGRNVKHIKEIDYEWLRIPHFYRGYYVFKYATGLTSAICIASKVLNEGAVNRYLKFLSSGGKTYPHDILCEMGVDLTTPEPYNIAFGEMQWALNELKNIVGKI